MADCNGMPHTALRFIRRHHHYLPQVFYTLHQCTYAGRCNTIIISYKNYRLVFFYGFTVFCHGCKIRRLGIADCGFRICCSDLTPQPSPKERGRAVLVGYGGHTSFRLQIADCRLQIADCRFQISDFVFRFSYLLFLPLHFRQNKN